MIDAHVHLWRIGRNGCTWPTPDLAAIHRDFTPDDLMPVLEAAGMEGAILVQSQEDPADTRWLLALAEADPRILAVIGWCDLADPAAVAALAAHPKLRGLRPMVQDRADDWYDDPARDAGYAAMAGHGLVLDALVQPRHLPALARLAARHPALTIVIDHGAKPVLPGPGAWVGQIEAIARLPNVHAKLSGLLTELPAGAPEAAVAPAAATLLAAFGPDRLLWGSDWPVLTLASDYPRWLALAHRLVPPANHDAVFVGNARRLYRLNR